MAPRRGLADELADLINPAPQQEVDPEGGWGEGALLNASDDELEQQVAKQASRKAKEKGFQLRGDIELDDVIYKGRKTSRAAVFGDEAAGGTAPWEDVSDGEEEDDDINGDGGDKDSEDDGELGELGSSEEEDDGSDDGEEEEEEEENDGMRLGKKGGLKGMAAAGKLGGKKKKGMNGIAHASDDEEGKEESDGEGESEDNGEDEENGADGLEEFLNGRASADSEEEGDDEEEEDEDTDMARRRSHAEAGTSAPGMNGTMDEGDDEDDDEVKQLEREYQNMQQEEAQLVRVDAQQGVKEVLKGRAVKCQQQLWERGLELRILLQKGLLGCHRLPQPPVKELVLEQREDIAERHAALRDAAEGCLVALSSVMIQLMMRQEDMATRLQQPPSSSGKKRTRGEFNPLTPPPAGASCNTWWNVLDHQWDAFTSFRDGSLDRWHRRTRLAAGNTMLKNSLRALDQSISSQVASMMSGPANKRAKRAHMLLSARPKLLCHPKEEDSEDKAKVAAPTSEAQEEEDERAMDTYDDSEFYQQLLKELLESGTSGGVSYAAIKSQKKRKNVDRRASKGRKIRYHVHEKLVNFATPIEMQLPPFAEHLFANLFGRKAA